MAMNPKPPTAEVKDGGPPAAEVKSPEVPPVSPETPTPAPAPPLKAKTADASIAHALKSQGPRYFVGLKNYTGGSGSSSASYKGEDGEDHEVPFVDGVAEVQEHELVHFSDEARFHIVVQP